MKADGDERLRRESKIITAVKEIRAIDPAIGGLKLWFMLCDVFGKEWLPGRDAFMRILRENSLLCKPRKRRHTTNSNHRYHKWKNLIKDFVPSGSNQLWVSDITYIDTDEGSCYLHLITDAYSHKIIGWCVAPTLEAIFTLTALRMAISQAEGYDLTKTIHHSDRGVQYCCDIYIEELQKYGISISMTEDYKPTDNAIAERVNGTIKTEYVYVQDRRFKNYLEAKENIGKFIDFYNNRRPHMSIGMQTPSQAHTQTGEQKKCWKKKIYRKDNGIVAANA